MYKKIFSIIYNYKSYKEFFNHLAEQVINLCRANGKEYYIKSGPEK